MFAMFRKTAFVALVVFSLFYLNGCTEFVCNKDKIKGADIDKEFADGSNNAVILTNGDGEQLYQQLSMQNIDIVWNIGSGGISIDSNMQHFDYIIGANVPKSQLCGISNNPLVDYIVVAATTDAKQQAEIYRDERTEKMFIPLSGQHQEPIFCILSSCVELLSAGANPVVKDFNRDYYFEENVQDSIKLFLSTDIQEAKKILQKYNTSLILIDEEDLRSLTTLSFIGGKSSGFSAISDCTLNSGLYTCGGNVFDESKMESIPTEWTDTPIKSDMPNLFVYRKKDNSKVFIFNAETNNTLLVNLWFKNKDVPYDLLKTSEIESGQKSELRLYKVLDQNP